MAKAGSAAVQFSDLGATIRSLQYALPDYLDQSFVIGEIVVLLHTVKAADPNELVEIATDCAAVFFELNNLDASTHHAKMHAGLWRQIAEVAESKRIKVHKPKAHQSKAEASACGDE